jgi:uncharacterized cupin superfamily protein
MARARWSQTSTRTSTASYSPLHLSTLEFLPCHFLTSTSIRTQTTDSPTYITSGFYRVQAGPVRDIPQFESEESKYVLNGQIDVLDEATGIMHHLVAGDFAFFHKGSKAQFSTKSGGTAFFVVTRPIVAQHPGLKGREEKVQSKL